MTPLIRLVPTGNDEFGGPVNRALDDGSDSWWGGAVQCFAGVALAATMAASTLGAQLSQQAQLQEQHEITQAPPTVVDDDAGWVPGPPAVPVANPFAIVIQIPQPWSFETPDPSGSLYVAQDELPAPVTVLPWPTPLTPAPWSFEQHESAAGLYNPQDENPAPVVVVPPLAYVVPQQATFEQHELATGLYVPQDELPAPVTVIPPTPNVIPVAWGFEQHESAAGLYAVQDEDPQPIAVPASGRSIAPPIVPQPFAWDQSESIATTVVDDSGDAWSAWTPSVPPLAPIVVPSILPPAWGYEQHEQAAGLYVPQDEVPAPVVTPPWASNVVPPTWGFEQHEAPPRIADDSGDVWTPAIVARGQAIAPYVAPLTVDGDTPGGLHGQPDEDYWNNPVAAIPASLTPPNPWAFEQHEIAGVVLYPDEDYWRNRVAPVAAALAWPAPSSFEQHERATGLYVPQDEDPQPVAVPASPAPVVPWPWSFEQHELPSLAIHETDAIAIAPPQLAPRVVIAFSADDDLPARTLVDDDPGYQPITPRSASSTPVIAWSADAHDCPPQIADDTGDVWNVILTPWPNPIAPPPWSFDSSEIPALTIDDDAGTSGPQLALGVALQSASQIAAVVASQPIVDAEDVPELFGQPDEDFWTNAVAPVPMAFTVPQPFAWEPHDVVRVFRTPHHIIADLDAAPRADAELTAAPRATATLVLGPRVDAVPDTFERVAATLTPRPRMSARLTINGVLLMTTSTVTRVRIHASNVLQLSELTDFLDTDAEFTAIVVNVRIIRKGDLSELTASTQLPAQPGDTGVYAVTLTKEVAPFVKDEVYIAQFSATMKDAELNDVDYYEELELIGAVR